MTKNSSGSDLRGELAELVKRRTEIAVIPSYDHFIISPYTSKLENE